VLHYWVQEAHVDGFRFDEGSSFRAVKMERLPLAPASLAYRAGRILGDTKVIAEAWDAAGLYTDRAFSRRPMGGMERPLSR